MHITVENIQDAIRSLGEHWAGFHLAPCAECGCPSWQQPCPICGFYPIGAQGYASAAEIKQQHPPQFQRFESWILRHGNIFEGVMAQVDKLVPQGRYAVMPQVARARIETEGWTWPTARELWDTFGEDSEPETRPKATFLLVRATDVLCPERECGSHRPNSGPECREWLHPRYILDEEGCWVLPVNGEHQSRRVAAYDARRLELRDWGRIRLEQQEKRLRSKVRDWMRKSCEDYDEGSEINCTRMAEDAAAEFGIYEDFDQYRIPEWVFEEAVLMAEAFDLEAEE